MKYTLRIGIEAATPAHRKLMMAALSGVARRYGGLAVLVSENEAEVTIEIDEEAPFREVTARIRQAIDDCEARVRSLFDSPIWGLLDRVAALEAEVELLKRKEGK